MEDRKNALVQKAVGVMREAALQSNRSSLKQTCERPLTSPVASRSTKKKKKEKVVEMKNENMVVLISGVSYNGRFMEKSFRVTRKQRG